MRKLSMVLVIVALMFTVVFASGTDTDYRAYGQMELSSAVEQITGENQFETAYKVAKLNDPNPSTVVIVRGDKVDGVPQVIDGLTASGIAGMENASILLVAKDEIPSATEEALQDLNPSKAIIIGGTAAVSEKVETQIQSSGIETRRIFGLNRTETAANVALEIGQAKEDTAIIVDSYAVVDSLVAGPLAYAGYPILMVENRRNIIPEATKDALKKLDVKEVIIVGGSAVVSHNIEDQLNNIEGIKVKARYGGSDRMHTSLKLGGHKVLADADGVSLINGWKYVDAVAASTMGGPIVYYAERSGITEEIESFISTKSNIRILGDHELFEESAVEKPAEEIGSSPTHYRSSYYEEEYISLDFTSQSKLQLQGSISSDHRFGWLQVRDKNGKRVVSEIFELESPKHFSREISLGGVESKEDSPYEIRFFTAKERYSTYQSQYLGIMFENTEEGLRFKRSLIYDDNVKMLMENNAVDEKDLSLAHLKAEDRKVVKELAESITKGMDDEYQQVKAIHDWVAKNIYYDYDGVRLNQRGRNDTMDTLNRRIAVCQGYSELTASLLRSIEIPARLANGYALGASVTNVTWDTADLSSSNHAWNEAYVDGRWIIMDTTWNSTNRYENEKMTTGSIRNTYFDMTVEAFSNTHKVFNRQRTIYLRY